MSEGKEIVLPSGRFARMRPLTWIDRASCENANTGIMVIMVACRAVTLDDEPMTVEQAMHMPLEEANPIIEMVAKALIEGVQSKGVA